MQAPFSTTELQKIPFGDGGLLYCPNWLPLKLANLYFHRLRIQTQWQQSTIRVAGRPVNIPRLNAWYGDVGANYHYSGLAFTPLPWTRTLGALKNRLQHSVLDDELDLDFNSALLNLYRHGDDSVAWHTDDEAELGAQPLIASISLGASRRFLFKRRDGSQRQQIDLKHGSLMIMLPPMQSHWLHCLPKTKIAKTARINVTFRQVLV